MMLRIILLRLVLLLLTVSLTSGCASKALILDTNSVRDEAVLFDTITLDPNHLHGVFINYIDGQDAYETQFRRLYQDESRNSLAWVLPSGVHKLDLLFLDSATILGSTAKSRTAFFLEMAAQGIYAPETVVSGDEVEWRIIEKRSGSILLGPWRTTLHRGFTFRLDGTVSPRSIPPILLLPDRPLP